MENGKTPAFSSVQLLKHGVEPRECLGLSKREYMATQILTGLVVPAIPGSHNADTAHENKYKAEHAVNLADALLEALSKP
jgi:hypothetical protein